MNEKVERLILKIKQLIDKYLEDEKNLIVSEKDREIIVRELVEPILKKVRFVKNPILDKKEFMKKVYVIVDKDTYDSWFDKNGNIREDIEDWEKKAAELDWESRRKSKDGTRAIFEINLNKKEYKSFVKHNWEVVEDEDGEIKEKKRKKKHWKENSDDDGLEGFKKKLDEDLEWSDEDGENKEDKGHDIKPKKLNKQRKVRHA